MEERNLGVGSSLTSSVTSRSAGRIGIGCTGTLSKRRPEGTLVTDHLDYRVPLGWLVEHLFVARELRRIFGYRRKRLLEIFS